MRRMLLVLPILALALALTGCGGQPDKESSVPDHLHHHVLAAAALLGGDVVVTDPAGNLHDLDEVPALLANGSQLQMVAHGDALGDNGAIFMRLGQEPGAPLSVATFTYAAPNKANRWYVDTDTGEKLGDQTLVAESHKHDFGQGREGPFTQASTDGRVLFTCNTHIDTPVLNPWNYIVAGEQGICSVGIVNSTVVDPFDMTTLWRLWGGHLGQQEMTTPNPYPYPGAFSHWFEHIFVAPCDYWPWDTGAYAFHIMHVMAAAANPAHVEQYDHNSQMALLPCLNGVDFSTISLDYE